MKIWKGKFRVLPLLVLVGLLSFIFRAGDFAGSLSSYANAEEQKEGHLPNTPDFNKQGSNKVMDLTPQAGDKTPNENDEEKNQNNNEVKNNKTNEENAPEGKVKGPDVSEKWRDAVDTSLDTRSVQKEMLNDLAERRKRLSQKAQKIAQREALLRAAEKELERKFDELSALRNDIKKLLEEQSKEEQERTESLVKIYSGMKPKDAARIFNTLNIDILVDIMTRMSERKTGPILAEMESEKAREVTIRMAEDKKLPEIPNDLRN